MSTKALNDARVVKHSMMQLPISTEGMLYLFVNNNVDKNFAIFFAS